MTQPLCRDDGRCAGLLAVLIGTSSSDWLFVDPVADGGSRRARGHRVKFSSVIGHLGLIFSDCMLVLYIHV